MDNLKSIDVKIFNQSRHALYNLLARFYEKEADKQFLKALNDFIVSQKYNDNVSVLHWVNIQKFISNNENNIEEILAVDYAKLFLGMGKKAEGAFPYESVYTSHRGIMIQDAYEQVLKIYRENGFDINSDIKIPADHIYIELCFMGELCLKNDITAQKVFLENHLLNWVPFFCEDIKKISDTDFYKSAASITEEWLKLDKMFLS